MSICRKLIEIWYAAASDKGEPSHPDPEIIKRGREGWGVGGWGRGRSPKKFFSALWSSVWSKYKGELKPLCWMDPPLCKGCNLPVFWQGNVSRGGSHPIHFFEKKNQPPGGILPYISYIGFLRRFGLKTSIQFVHFVWNRVWFFRELGSVWTYLSFQFQMSKKERKVCEFEMALNNF